MQIVNTQPTINYLGQTVLADCALVSAKRTALAYVFGGLVSAVKETAEAITAGRAVVKPCFADDGATFTTTLDVWWYSPDAGSACPDVMVTIAGTPGRNDWTISVSSDALEVGTRIMDLECKECSRTWATTFYSLTNVIDVAFCALLREQVTVNREFEWENSIGQALEYEKRKREEVDDD